SATFNLPEGTNPYFEVVMDIPQGLVWSGNNDDLRYVSGALEWIPNVVSFDSNTRKLTAQYPFPIPITLTRSEFRLKLTLDCALPNANGLATVGMQLFYIMDSTCPNPYRMSMTCYETPMTYLYCPGPCSEGLAFKSFEIQRTSFGQADNDKDGLPDNSGAIDLTKVKTNRIMMSDTFKTIFNGKILTSASYPSWEYGYANSSLPTYGDKVKAFAANVTITDKSTGNILTCDKVPFTTSLSGTTLTVNSDFSAPTLAALGYTNFNGFVLEDEDEVVVEVHYTLFDNIGGNIEQVLVTNDFYVASTVNGTAFQCNNWSGNVTFIGYYFTTYKGEQYDINTCTKTIAQNYYLSIGNCCSNYAGGDFFPYEYRNWARIKDLRVEIPDGFSVKKAYMDYYRTVHVNNTTLEQVGDMQPTAMNGQEYTYDLEQYFTSNGGNLNLGDDGFNGTVYLELDPNCQAQQKKDLPVVWNYRFREVDRLTGAITHEYNAHTDYINYVRGDLRITTNLKTVEGVAPTVSWDINIKNRAVTSAPNSWLYIASPAGILTVLHVEEIATGTILTPVNGFYQLGEITGNQRNKYRITASSNNCTPSNIVTYTGYSCDGYPTDFASIDCPFRELALAMTPQISELQTRVREIYDPAIPCDPVFGVELEMLSSKLAAVKDILISITTPNNGSITIVPNSTEVLYPQANSFTTISDPVLSGNTYSLTGADIDPIIGTNGLEGITDVSANIAKVRFEFRTESNFQPGDFLQFDIAGNRSCGNPLPTLSLAYDPNAVFAEPDNIGLNATGDTWAASWGDYNGDGQVDLFITTHDLDSPNELYKNNGDGTFTKVTSGPIATDKASSLAASWADYDNDQDLDLVVANNIGSPNFLYRNEGGGNFIRLQNDPIVNNYGYAHGISWVDYDRDGHLDLFVASFFATQFNDLYHNNGDGTFTKASANAITMEASSSTCGVWADYNNDGLIDLFVANTYGENNSLYENKGNGNFLKINTGSIVNDGGHSVGGSWADYDNDGDLDLFVANAANEDNFLYQNNGNGTFTKVTTGIIVNDAGHSHGSGWADYDNDGWIDLFVANDQNQDNYLYKNNRDGSFTKVENAISKSGGMSFGAAWADYDNDGGIDLFVANRDNNENFLYQNVKGACQGKSCITLVGTNSNQSAIGAKIYVTATVYGQTITQMREITAQSGGGIGGQSELKAIFGVGDAGIIEEIKVKWPSGYEQVLDNQMVDDCLVITEENAAKVCGIVFHDENENCIQDGEEKGIANQKILLTPGNHVVFTDENGRYEAFVPVTNYDVLTEVGTNWALSCASTQAAQQVNVLEIGAEYCGFDFGYKATCVAPDLNVEAAVTAHRVGFENLVSLTYRNAGTTAASDVVLSLNLDAYCVPIESTIPWTRQEGQTVYWDFLSIPAGTKRTIYLTDSVAATTPIGQELVIEANIESTETDCNVADNAFRGTELAIGALDPNDILVFPEGNIKTDEVLTYKIRFQNVGNLPVANVRIESSIPAELDEYTFELGIGSHPFRFEQKDNALFWEFPNIMLADSVNNEPESHGYVTFRVLPKADLPIGTIIENDAKIFFDNMEPVATNVVRNIIQPAITKEQFAGKLLAYPNPTNGVLNVQLIPLKTGETAIIRELTFYNLQGLPVKSIQNLETEQLTIDLTDLPTGLYYMKAINQEGTISEGKVLVAEM
ncbi:MAG: FG-GAP-like repeat-containing protein, partial [Saprospiraceae bacterium]